ncbi:class I SAM-dependent methyltransferase [Candidatus Saccharibacteria bacterium]|nr:class I SAM-dependent methyltransferase [Candidatus Saccharibacteria bacterium]
MSELYSADTTPEKRQEFLETADVENEQTWQTVYALARESEERGLEKGLRGISADQLIGFAEAVRHLDTPVERYLQTLEPSPTGKLWFDELYGFSSPTIVESITDFMQKVINRHRAKLGQGIDLGTGTGVLAKRLAGFCDSFAGLDRSTEFLTIARERTKNKIGLVAADVTRLPFRDESFDLVTSCGLIFSLDRTKSIDFITELSRTLKSPGVYMDGFVTGSHGDVLRSYASWKDSLADMVVDTVSGRSEITDRLSYADSEFNELKEQLGLDYNTIPMGPVRGSTGQAVLRMITKQ